MVETYAESEPWKSDHDFAMSVCDLEEHITWGLGLHRWLNEAESRLQDDILASRCEFDEAKYSELANMLGMWAGVAEHVVEAAQIAMNQKYTIRDFDEFFACLKEARAVLANRAMESEIRPIEELRPLAKHENPDPERYGD